MKRTFWQVAYGGRGEKVNDYKAGLPVDHQEGDILINAFPSRVGVVANLLASPVAVCCVSFLLEMALASLISRICKGFWLATRPGTHAGDQHQDLERATWDFRENFGSTIQFPACRYILYFVRV